MNSDGEFRDLKLYLVTDIFRYGSVTVYTVNLQLINVVSMWTVSWYFGSEIKIETVIDNYTVTVQSIDLQVKEEICYLTNVIHERFQGGVTSVTIIWQIVYVWNTVGSLPSNDFLGNTWNVFPKGLFNWCTCYNFLFYKIVEFFRSVNSWRCSCNINGYMSVSYTISVDITS